jgi:glycosyltransferase involved in cell wall biosynthesis
MSLEIQALNPDHVILLSVFEHPFNVVPLNNQIFKHLGGIFYDLIPMQFPEIFPFTAESKLIYEKHIDQILNLDYLFSISETSINHLKHYAPEVPPYCVIYGSGFSKNSPNHGLPLVRRNGVFCVGSDSRHKNLRNLIIAYSLLPSLIQESHPLKIAGVPSKIEKDRLGVFAKSFNTDLVILEGLDDTELSEIYASSRLTVVPSWEEGLGMPIFEAWNEGCVVVGSSGTAISEVLGSSDLCFDAHDVASMCSRMLDFLQDDQMWIDELNRIDSKRLEFTWALTAERATSFFETIVEK